MRVRRCLIALALAVVLLLGACTGGDTEPRAPRERSAVATVASTPAAERTVVAPPPATATIERIPTETATVEPTPTSTATPTLPPLPTRLSGGIEPFPPDTRTGIPELDVVIDALMVGDVETLMDLIEWQSIACSNKGWGLPSPPSCPPGVADGTLVDAIPWQSGEGSHRRPDEVRRSFAAAFEDERELCRIGERPLADGVVTYFVVLRAIPEYVPDYGYLEDELSVSVRQGHVITGRWANEPSSALPVCR